MLKGLKSKKKKSSLDSPPPARAGTPVIPISEGQCRGHFDYSDGREGQSQHLTESLEAPSATRGLEALLCLGSPATQKVQRGMNAQRPPPPPAVPSWGHTQCTRTRRASRASLVFSNMASVFRDSLRF